MILPGRVAAGVLVLVTATGALAACSGGGEGGGSLPTPTRSVTFEPTRSPSAPERPAETATTSAPASPTAAPTETPSETPTKTPTKTAEPTQRPTPTESPSRTAPAPTSTVTVTEQATPSAAPSSSATPSAGTEVPADEAAGSEAQAEESTPSWVWWLLAAAALALAVGTPLVVRARRRNAWSSRLEAGEVEAAWFARELVPELRRSSQSVERLAGAWTVGGAERIRRLEDDLTGLEATAPDDESRERAVRLRDAVRDGRQRLNALTVPGRLAVPGVELDIVAASIEAALAPPPQT